MREQLTRAAEAKHAALNEFRLACQRNEFEAQQALTKEVQQAQAELDAGEGEAQVEFMGFTAALQSDEISPEEAIESRHQFERDAHERRRSAESRVEAAQRAYSDRAKESREELAQQWASINHDHLRRLQEIWAELDPEAVEPEDLVALAGLTAEAAQHVPIQP